MGDGLMAVFGIPTAHENDPDRAVHAALNMLAVARHYAAELEEQWRITGYQVRLGINTGLIVISGSEGSEELSGATINLAARLEQAADPDTILISGSTHQHVGGAFDLQPLEPIMAKGFPEPVPVYRVRAARPYSFRSRRRGVAGIVTKLVGRESELNMLQDAYHKVIEEGEQRVVTIVGEAGIGKSRLLHEFENWLDQQSAAERKLFRGRSQPEKQALPYAFLRDLFASQFNVQDDDAAGVVRKKIEAGFSEELRAGERGEILPSDVESDLEMRAHFIGQLLGYDFRGSSHLASILDNAQKLRDRAISYLDDYFRELCASGPVVILLEDLHWVDDSSLDALSSLSLSMRNQPLQIIGAARPELFERRPDWYEGRAFHRRLDLQPLSEQESRNLVIDVLHEAEHVPDALLDLIVSNAEGNPFYVEELIKMLVQQGVVVREERRWRVLTGRLAELHVPPSLSGVLQARRITWPERSAPSCSRPLLSAVSFGMWP
jgi:type II secretory pathway predicted ATPase ExeA